MKRKVSQVGPATLMVSLPSKWARRYSVKPGDEVDLVEDGPKLIIGAGPVTEAEISLDLSNAGNMMRRIVVYRAQCAKNFRYRKSIG